MKHPKGQASEGPKPPGALRDELCQGLRQMLHPQAAGQNRESLAKLLTHHGLRHQFIVNV